MVIITDALFIITFNLIFFVEISLTLPKFTLFAKVIWVSTELGNHVIKILNCNRNVANKAKHNETTKAN
jgi:hypothetical protein